ncbi:helix-turn-helix transcriptional regulator [Flavobacterium microcysteis]|uniref:DNA-binding response regulator n=1 Tax=Flavobacterium microcysteis TaxID=2596891 RepID=A0A501QML8_9FLAO|nr:LuxR C-terminal-related transcriptional regulator [Flavobacterium microcysteis]TPD73501.1 DNA-binding response regulator [Flavobacterium microcysteis]
MREFFQKYKSTILYGFSLAVLLFLMKWLEFRLIVIDHALEIYIGSIAVVFTALGIWLALKLTKPKKETIIVEKEIYVNDAEFVQDRNQLEKLNLSKREMEVLELIAQGCSNQEIASQLFVSLPTIKTHSSKLFEKLDVNRRTQAVEKAKRLKLIP